MKRVAGSLFNRTCTEIERLTQLKMAIPNSAPRPLIDAQGRRVSYLRISVTDRCDLRCSYCMPEAMHFMSHKDLLRLEEIYRLAALFIRLGVRKIRITGGEPLMRKNVISLFEMLSPHIDNGDLDEVALTTNGSQLPRYARALFDVGVRRINVSLDTLDADRYRALTRFGDIKKVLAGIDCAQQAGLKVKINAVALPNTCERDVDELIWFAHSRQIDLTLIEEMPLGTVSHDRRQSFVSLTSLEADLRRRWTLVPIAATSGGPARYVRIAETGGTLGFITPLSCKFCSDCNRVRLDCTGRLFTCMSNEGSTALRETLRNSSSDHQLESLIFEALANKPASHAFSIDQNHVEGIDRHMSVLGG